MGALGDLCIRIEVLKIEAVLLVFIYHMCGTAATPTNGKDLVGSRVLMGKSQCDSGREKTDSLSSNSMWA